MSLLRFRLFDNAGVGVKELFFFLFTIFCALSLTNCEKQRKYAGKYTYEVKEFQVPVDHFNFANNNSFNIRYLYNETYADKHNERSPVFFYTGNEGDIEAFAQNSGFIWELAAKMRAYVVFAEHRYYGKSLPFGSATFNTSQNIGYLSVEQALEDYASLIDHLVGDKSMPVIAFGGSYGGMLAAWFRMKYPHIIAGALAASAPIYQFNDLTPCNMFARITTSVFTTAYTSNCSVNIRNSWKVIETLAASDDGKKQIAAIFQLCDPLKTQDDLTRFQNYLEDTYGKLAMVNYPYENNFLSPLPAYPVRQFCLYVKDLYNGTGLLTALQSALSVYTNYTGTTKCLDYKALDDPNLGDGAWDIQACNQMVMPMCSRLNDTMFRNKEWNLKAYSDECYRKYQIRPKLRDIQMRYGGKDLRTVSNIIFSNGLLDPWSGGGVLQSPNNEVTVIILPEGAHHLDLRQTDVADPNSVKEARKKETEIIGQWIAEFLG